MSEMNDLSWKEWFLWYWAAPAITVRQCVMCGKVYRIRLADSLDTIPAVYCSDSCQAQCHALNPDEFFIRHLAALNRIANWRRIAATIAEAFIVGSLLALLLARLP